LLEINEHPLFKCLIAPAYLDSCELVHGDGQVLEDTA
jgi:hypothetical protein